MAVESNAITEVQFVYNVNGQVCRNVFHYRNGGEIVGITGAEFAAAMLTQHFGGGASANIAAFLNAVSEDVILEKVTAQEIFPSRWRVQESPINLPGAIAQPCDAQNLQVSVKKTADEATRHGRGGFHLGGVPDGEYTAGIVSAGQRALVDLFATAMFADMNVVIGGTPRLQKAVILNKENEGTPTDPDWVITGGLIITDWEVMPQLRTQRSRNVGKGE